jgi:hypothetical protein
MAFFIFPQKWIATAIAAAAVSFGPINSVGDISIHYVNLPGKFLGATRPPGDIGIDKRPKSAWPKWKAQCVIVHEYGHLAGRQHSSNPRNIMRPHINKRVCLRWLRQHHVK